jgi:simple sugar transport system permease protein
MKRSLRPLAATAVIFIIAYAASVLQFPSMLSTRVLGNFLTDNAFLGIAAVGMTFVIISGGIDLSVGAVIGFTGVLVAVLISWLGIHPLVAFVIALGVAALFGAAMGMTIHYLQVPSFIVTLAGMFLARGLCYLISINSITIEDPLYLAMSQTQFSFLGGFISPSAVIAIGMLALAIFIAHFTAFGRGVYAIGGNEQSALMMGLPGGGRTKVLVYAFSGFCAALAGVLFSFYMLSGYGLHAQGTELDAIAAVVIGGTLLSGGYGYVAGALSGVLVLGTIQTLIAFDGTLSSWWTRIVIGALLFIFCVVQRLMAMGAARRVA